LEIGQIIHEPDGLLLGRERKGAGIMMQSIVLAFGPISSPVAYIVLGIVAVLLFGNRLPGVMRSLGRSVVEFKKGVSGIEEELDEAVRRTDEKTKTASENSEV
jgi:sec-independent protein translocase protein TatA